MAVTVCATGGNYGPTTEFTWMHADGGGAQPRE